MLQMRLFHSGFFPKKVAQRLCCSFVNTPAALRPLQTFLGLRAFSSIIHNWRISFS